MTKNDELREAIRDAIDEELNKLLDEMRAIQDQIDEKDIEALMAGLEGPDHQVLRARGDAITERILEILRKLPELARALGSDQSGTA